MGRKSFVKGRRVELEIVHRYKEMGIWAQRLSYLGCQPGQEHGDILVKPCEGVRLIAEVKSRSGGKGFLTLRKWMQSAECLILHADREEPLVVLPWDQYVLLMTRAYPVPNKEHAE